MICNTTGKLCISERDCCGRTDASDGDGVVQKAVPGPGNSGLGNALSTTSKAVTG
jgi:hypothetical protein